MSPMLVDFPVELLFHMFAALPTDALYALARCSRLLNTVAISLLLPRFSIDPTAKSHTFHLVYDELDALSILALAFSVPLTLETLTIAFPEHKIKLDPNVSLAAQDLSFDPTSVYPDAGHIRRVANVMHRLRSLRTVRLDLKRKFGIQLGDDERQETAGPAFAYMLQKLLRTGCVDVSIRSGSFKPLHEGVPTRPRSSTWRFPCLGQRGAADETAPFNLARYLPASAGEFTSTPQTTCAIRSLDISSAALLLPPASRVLVENLRHAWLDSLTLDLTVAPQELWNEFLPSLAPGLSALTKLRICELHKNAFGWNHAYNPNAILCFAAKLPRLTELSWKGWNWGLDLDGRFSLPPSVTTESDPDWYHFDPAKYPTTGHPAYEEHLPEDAFMHLKRLYAPPAVFTRLIHLHNRLPPGLVDLGLVCAWRDAQDSALFLEQINLVCLALIDASLTSRTLPEIALILTEFPSGSDLQVRQFFDTFKLSAARSMVSRIMLDGDELSYRIANTGIRTLFEFFSAADVLDFVTDAAPYWFKSDVLRITSYGPDGHELPAHDYKADRELMVDEVREGLVEVRDVDVRLVEIGEDSGRWCFVKRKTR